MTAEHRGWGKGWPTDRSRDMLWVEAAGVRVAVHKTLAPLIGWLLDETAQRGYRLRRGECWGYACRAISGTQTASNHSWGLAVDLNAPTNPMTTDGRLVTDMPTWMPALWKTWGFGWGGDWARPKDPMHFEFLGTPTEAKAYIQKIRNAALMPPPPMEVPPRMNPPIEIAGRVVDVLKAPNGGVWMLTEPGAIYAWHCPDLGAPNRHPEYWPADARAARLEPLGTGYTVVRSEGSRYDYPGTG
jgi:hypothetical protein